MTATTARSKLRQALSDELVPALLELGFSGPVAIKGIPLDHEYRRATSAGVQVLSIQLDKHQLPRFVVNLHIEPHGGVDKVIAEGGRLVLGRLQARRGPWARCWFCADRPWWQKAIFRRTDTLEREAVRLCLSYLPEVEGWWSSQGSSTHIVSWEIQYQGAGAAGA